ncbi:hypothetical protein DOK76_00180 [Vagococcus sp. DIV0080]|uniref:5-bromo-4-chloroindolyl phosphate hydrolysis protein n=1 Tax=Candidatus Vagococcus giribetii TaxID=2230876 RepID=A0ABS3HRF2_9ENTE|nr:hypothetical protein [Vagococcus sp. DIV0080]MBO0475461.1 hypothetical protein [Vagococcus sp. DIV0080]
MKRFGISIIIIILMVISVFVGKLEWFLIGFSAIVFVYLVFHSEKIEDGEIKDIVPIVLAMFTLIFSLYSAIQVPTIEKKKMYRMAEANASYIQEASNHLVDIFNSDKDVINKWNWESYVKNVKSYQEDLERDIDISKLDENSFKNIMLLRREMDNYISILDYCTMYLDAENIAKNKEVNYQVPKDVKDNISDTFETMSDDIVEYNKEIGKKGDLNRTKAK